MNFHGGYTPPYGYRCYLHNSSVKKLKYNYYEVIVVMTYWGEYTFPKRRHIVKKLEHYGDTGYFMVVDPCEIIAKDLDICVKEKDQDK